MAASAAAAMLDELMGRNRNVGPNEKPPEIKWTDDQVCKYYLCGFCPHDLFVNTKADLGPCTKIHDDNLREEFQKRPMFETKKYQDDFVAILQQIISDKERRVKRAQSRLELTASRSNMAAETVNEKDKEKVELLTEKINEFVAKIEMLGSEGKVEEAQGMMKLVEELKDEREMIIAPTPADLAVGMQEKQMEVCHVCAAFLIVGDAQSRIDDHLMGKQHMGYAKIKAKMEEIMEARQKEAREFAEERQRRIMERAALDKQPSPEGGRMRGGERMDKMRGERDRERERYRGGRGRDGRDGRDMDRDRGRHRGGDRDGYRDRDRERDRDKDRHRDRDRDRDRERRRHDRHHNGGESSSSRHRDRSRERSDRKRRSGSGEGDRSRSPHDTSKRRSPPHDADKPDTGNDQDPAAAAAGAASSHEQTDTDHAAAAAEPATSSPTASQDTT